MIPEIEKIKKNNFLFYLRSIVVRLEGLNERQVYCHKLSFFDL